MINIFSRKSSCFFNKKVIRAYKQIIKISTKINDNICKNKFYSQNVFKALSPVHLRVSLEPCRPKQKNLTTLPEVLHYRIRLFLSS